MASSRMVLFLASLLLVVSAVPNIDYDIHSIDILDDDLAGIQIGHNGKTVTNADDIAVMTTDRAPQENATFAVKNVQAGYARTTNVGITVQKGTEGTLSFHIRVRAVTTETLALKSLIFEESLTESQKHELRKLGEGYHGGFDIPWLKLLGIDLTKSSSEKDFIKVRSATVNYDKLALLAKKILEETVSQTIEVKGTLTAWGVSYIPTTVFSFIKIANLHFQDGSKMMVLSEHPGSVAAASKGGKVVPSAVDSFEIIS